MQGLYASRDLAAAIALVKMRAVWSDAEASAKGCAYIRE